MHWPASERRAAGGGGTADLRANDPRIAIIRRLERYLLVVRYLAYLWIVGAYAVDAPSLRGDEPELYALATVGLLHNVYVHWVLWTRRYQCFQGTFNFMVYLLEVSLLVGLGGASGTPLFGLYILFIVGFAIYSRRFQGALLVTTLCLACYGLTLAGEAYFIGWSVVPAWVAVKVVLIAICGMLVGTLYEFLRVTEIEREEQAEMLASSEATLRTILDSTDEPILVFGEDELIADANNRACRYLGTPRRELLGQRFRTFLFDDGTMHSKLATVRSRGAYRGEAIAETPQGEERNVELHLRAFTQDGRRYFVGLLHDITDQKNIQEASRAAAQRLEQLNEELRHVSELKSLFFANVARRMRSPLSAVLGFSDLLLREELGPLQTEQRDAVRVIRESVQRVFRILDASVDTPREAKPAAGDAAQPPAAPTDTGDTAADRAARERVHSEP